MCKTLTVIVVLGLLAVAPLPAQEVGVKPGPEHAFLKESEGDWDATVKSMGGESKGTMSYKSALNGLWMLEHFKAELGGKAFEGHGATSYDPKDGAENWHWMWTPAKDPLRTVSSPVLGVGLVLGGGGEGPNGVRITVAVKLGGKGDVSKTNLAWEQKSDFPYVSCLLISGDYVYFVNDAGFAHCRSLKDGEKVWSERLSGVFSSSPVLIDGKIYATNEDGVTYVFAAAPKYKLHEKNPLGEPVMATPAVADGKIYMRSKEHLFCIGKKK